MSVAAANPGSSSVIGQTDDERIFVQIASYRDTELLPTLRDCIERADRPDRLRFGVCWQHDDTETLDEFAHMATVRCRALHYTRSRGACWARSETQALYEGEPYTLQIDSHHRFVQGWDSKAKSLLRAATATGAQKPLLTSYAPHYVPGEDRTSWGSAPLRLRFNGFSSDGPPNTVPVEITSAQEGSGLERARFLSAHFIFTLGAFCDEVPYDPQLYFFGEEPAMALRAFTHGYDLFHPTQILLWHHYGRSDAPRHWSDNPRWALRNTLSFQRYRRLVDPAANTEDLGRFGCGTSRSVTDYENYAGLSLSRGRASKQALAGTVPWRPGTARWKQMALAPFGL